MRHIGAFGRAICLSRISGSDEVGVGRCNDGLRGSIQPVRAMNRAFVVCHWIARKFRLATLNILRADAEGLAHVDSEAVRAHRPDGSEQPIAPACVQLHAQHRDLGAGCQRAAERIAMERPGMDMNLRWADRADEARIAQKH